MVEFTMTMSVLNICIIAAAVVCCIVLVNFINMLITNALWKKISNGIMEYFDKLKDFYEDLTEI